MNTNPSLGTGFAGVLAHAVAAGIMASSRGSARAACAPFRNVRLGIAFFVINITLSFFVYYCWLQIISLLTGYRCFLRSSAPHLKRDALHDSENKRREPVSVFLGVANDLANGRRIVVLDASSERECQKLLRQRSRKPRCCDAQPCARASEDWRQRCFHRVPARLEVEEAAVRRRHSSTRRRRE